MKLGETRVTVRLHGPKGPVDVEMLVDTGATLSKIPESVARRIGIVITGTTTVELADGTLKERGEGQAEIEFMGRRMIIPLLVGPDGEEALFGLTTLETFKLKVNTVTQKLEPGRWIEYQALA